MKSDEQKKILMEMAKSGMNRPLSKNFWIMGYDPEFTKIIKKIRPDWFK